MGKLCNYIKPFKIADVEIPHNVILAPLAGISDFPFRQLVRKFGAQLTFTEMINVTAYLHQPKQTEKLLRIHPSEHPIGIQLMGNKAEDFEQIIPEIETFKPDVLDINFGCPVKKVTKTGGGAILLKDVEKIYDIVSTSVKIATIPVIAKIRLGWDDKSNYKEIVKAVEEAGAAAITVHGRTKIQVYSGEVDLEAMAEIKSFAQIPVIGNGNIFDAESALKMFTATGVDAIMLARGTFGNPGLFAEILSPSALDLSLKNKSIIKTLLEHYQLQIEEYGEKTAIYKMRKVALWYLNRIDFNSNHPDIERSEKVKTESKLAGMDEIKKKLLRLKNFTEINKLLENLQSEV
ncbi:MAG: tRNA-dihydrouridine synthase family protein [Calditrichia bacterium]|nr:tRNA-dihydrouridine synthase family protein [Calditrichia bacterium]